MGGWACSFKKQKQKNISKYNVDVECGYYDKVGRQNKRAATAV